MKVFWSWQSDTPSKCGNSFVRQALQDAVEQISSEHSLSEALRPDVDHDTKGVEGWAEIANTIFDKIDNAAVFVADVTPTIESEVLKKKSPNPNVLLELGYALKSLGSEPIVLVWNTAGGARPEDLPFDMRHRRGPVGYNLPASATTKERDRARASLAKVLKDILEPLLAKALAKLDAALVFDMYPSRPGDSSIWTGPGEKMEGRELWGTQGWKSFDVIESPRSYVRITPFGWARGIPTRDSVKATCKDAWLLCPLFVPNDQGGGWAENNLGIISIYDSEMPVPQTISSTQWFQRTGEVWSFDAGINNEYAGLRRLDGKSVLKNWYAFVLYNLGFYKKVHADYPIVFPIRIEIGISDIRNMVWQECAPDIGIFVEKPSGGLSKYHSFVNIGLLRSFKKGDIDIFLTKAYNNLLEAFNQAPVSESELLNLVGNCAWDSEILR